MQENKFFDGSRLLIWGLKVLGSPFVNADQHTMK